MLHLHLNAVSIKSKIMHIECILSPYPSPPPGSLSAVKLVAHGYITQGDLKWLLSVSNCGCRLCGCWRPLQPFRNAHALIPQLWFCSAWWASQAMSKSYKGLSCTKSTEVFHLISEKIFPRIILNQIMARISFTGWFILWSLDLKCHFLQG